MKYLGFGVLILIAIFVFTDNLYYKDSDSLPTEYVSVVLSVPENSDSRWYPMVDNGSIEYVYDVNDSMLKFEVPSGTHKISLCETLGADKDLCTVRQVYFEGTSKSLSPSDFGL